ncbi:hypothetical protein LJR231_002710 [Phyllobacterium sp. LjRoot231]|uniref:hypothetical protein n=1 Tax=Phyllobacterium sp. LjRoot231 TaxID=3342289 RepID=UPI003ECCA553
MVESQIERGLGTILLAQHDVNRIEDQPTAVRYKDDDGVVREHTFDFRAWYLSGKIVAFAAKASGQVARSGIRRTLSLICEQSLKGFAHEVVLVTQNQITDGRVWNASQVVRSRKMRNDEHCEQLRGFAAQFRGAISMADLISSFEVPAYGRNAMFCLIYDGYLVPIEPHERIQFTSLLAVNRN